MKTAIYIEDGVVQLVITPESEFEKNALATLENGAIQAKLFHGSFYDCRGGWTRQSQYIAHMHDMSPSKEDRSLILRVDTRNPEPKPE